MKRRKFIQNTLLTAGGLYIHQYVFPNSSQTNNEILKGFIVSDAHFGWENKAQPTPEKQQQMMETIFKRFPDLDLLIDTGDAHHDGNNRDFERGLWTDIIENPSVPLPFYYVPGNHEICHCFDNDPELICNQMGSISCRPYYSWDMKGIHFVSMPELENTIYMNQEILDWVALDLEINKDKTTILLSHNQVLNTTSGYAPGYRGILNSDDLWVLLKKYPNVKAWMHGHNHNYEMVEKDGVLFVSNGRIGGFDPSRGAHGLGGIYFEINKSRLTAKSYSAEKQKFLTPDDVNEKMHPQYHPNGIFMPDAELQFSTSLDLNAVPAIYYGMGGANSGTKFPVAHHHATAKGKSTLYIGNEKNRTLNNDPEFKYFVRSGRHGEKDEQTTYMGGNIRGKFDWLDPNGVKLRQSKKGSMCIIELPGRNYEKYSYFKVAPGSSYLASIEFDKISGGQSVQIICKLHSQSGQELKQFESELWTLKKGEKLKEFKVNIPKGLNTKAVQSGDFSENIVHLSFNFNVNTSMGDVIVKRVSIEPLNNGRNTINPTVCFDGKKLKKQGELSSWAKFDIPNPQSSYSVCEVHAEGTERLTWLVKHEAWDWQVRNAAVKDNGKSLEFSGLRNKWTHKKEVVFVPSGQINEPYVFKIRNALGAKIFPLNRGNSQLHFLIERLFNDKTFAEVEVLNLGNRKVDGAEIVETKDNITVLKVLPGKQVYIS